MIIKYFRLLQLLFVLTLISLSSCGTGSSQSETRTESQLSHSNETLKEEVITIHDEVMPKMGTLRSHQKRLTEEAAELESRNGLLYQDEIEKRHQIARELDEAYEGMFVWMRQFRPQELDDMDEEGGRIYLIEQKDKVIKVNEDIKSALKRAEETTRIDL